MKQYQFFALLFFILSGLIPQQLLAGDGDSGRRVIDTDSDRTDKQNFDKRLPPVVPGGEIFLNGKRIRVISTSGPVPVSPPPEAPTAACVPSKEGDCSKSRDNGSISVIVDERGDRHKPRPGRTLGDIRREK